MNCILTSNNQFAYSVGVPVSLLLILYMKYAQEVLFTSCPMILERYFQWDGVRAGSFLAFLSVTILPANFVASHIARKYEERTIVKVRAPLIFYICRTTITIDRILLYNSSVDCQLIIILQRSLFILAIGLFVMFNFGSIISLALQIQDLLTESSDRRRERKYDWLLGFFQYFAGCAITFIALTCIDGAASALLTKVSPPRIKSSNIALQPGTIVSLLCVSAQLLADCQILVVGLSHRLINTDLVNSLVVPLFIICLIMSHLVKKHYFFLM